MSNLPKTLGRYTLVHRLASGGMANLYLSRLVGTDGFVKVVAVKVIHDHLTEDDNFVKMFINEARLVSRINHPNVVHTLELGLVGRTHYIAMEYVNGESVNSLLKRTKPSLVLAARIVAEAAAGLQAAHSLAATDGQPLHVVHRDVSPENILISYDGAVKVADFGVARARGNLQTTRAGQVKGKFAYMAPEQLDQNQPIDHRADIFALGIVLYELTTGKRLFKSETEAETAGKVLSGGITLPSQRVQDYPISLEMVVLRALERDVERRFQSALELQEALERFIMESGEPVMQAQVGKLMSDVFKDRVSHKKEMLRKCEQGGMLETQEIKVISSPYVDVSFSSMEGLRSPAQARRRPALLIGGAAALVGIVVLALVLLLRSGPGSDAIAADSKMEAGPEHLQPDTAVAMITILIKASPSSAAIQFDGKDVGNPFELKRPAGEGEVEAEVSAPGYTPQRIQIPLATGGRYLVGLHPVPPVAPAPAEKVQKKKKRPKKKKKPRRDPKSKELGDDDVLDNPYGK
jgi:serine/threonine-protein kinase